MRHHDAGLEDLRAAREEAGIGELVGRGDAILVRVVGESDEGAEEGGPLDAGHDRELGRVGRAQRSLTDDPRALRDRGFLRTDYEDVEDYSQLHVTFDDGTVADVFATELVLGGVHNWLEVFANNHDVLAEVCDLDEAETIHECFSPLEVPRYTGEDHAIRTLAKPDPCVPPGEKAPGQAMASVFGDPVSFLGLSHRGV